MFLHINPQQLQVISLFESQRLPLVAALALSRLVANAFRQMISLFLTTDVARSTDGLSA